MAPTIPMALSWRSQALALLGVVGVLLAGGLWAWRETGMTARLVSAPADAVAAQSDLMRRAVARGAPVFAAHCASCHGADGRGDRGTGTPDLTDQDFLYGQGRPSDIERVIAYGIRSHHPKGWALADMPAFARSSKIRQTAILSPGEVADVTDFVTALNGRAVDPAAAARGAQVFETACSDCHGADAAGDSSIGAPNLTDRIWLFGDGDRAAVSQSIDEGRAGIMPAFQPRLGAAEVRAAALYVYRLSHSPAPSEVNDHVHRP